MLRCFETVSKVLIFSRWIGTSEQTSNIIRHNSIRCNSCVKSKNIGESFMMLYCWKWTFLVWGFVRWALWFKINTDFPKQPDALINQEILMYSCCVNLKQIGVAFTTLCLKIDLSELKVSKINWISAQFMCKFEVNRCGFREMLWRWKSTWPFGTLTFLQSLLSRSSNSTQIFSKKSYTGL